MILLRDMNAEEFAKYRTIFIGEYAQDLQNTRVYSAEKARNQASETLDMMLPQGIESHDNAVWCISLCAEPQSTVGYLWVGFIRQAAWINDFYILPDWRNRGLGRAALMEMKVRLKGMGINEVGLRVAPENPSAKALYEKCGFHITGINMSQNLN
ncbi:N-acetyltransferase [Rouxiella silvae]|uniref:N-acetyltransferase n=1 Tax=Rouxiella silvae TaxID=1646373 RepID=A0AA41BXD4_9GAMM|nr:GNAT family N-acetyltransferase [Rouxiella silvae]MBF6637947.1 N-acetyltransferase [Rouxiella silvae]